MRIRFPSLLIVAILVAATSVRAQDRDAELLNLMEEADIPGLGVAVLENGAVSYARTFGVRSTATNPPADTSR